MSNTALKELNTYPVKAKKLFENYNIGISRDQRLINHGSY